MFEWSGSEPISLKNGCLRLVAHQDIKGCLCIGYTMRLRFSAMIFIKPLTSFYHAKPTGGQCCRNFSRYRKSLQVVTAIMMYKQSNTPSQYDGIFLYHWHGYK